MLAMMRTSPPHSPQVSMRMLSTCSSAVREFYVNQFCTVMHCTAIKGIGRPGNSLIIKAKGFHIAD